MKNMKVEKFSEGQKAYRQQFANGLRAVVVPTKLAPVFSYQTWYNVGSRDEQERYSGLAHFFEHMMFKGTKHLPVGVFDKTMESHGARDLNAFTSTDYTAYIQSLPNKHLDLVARLESERMCNLLVAESEFKSEREVVRNERKQRNDNNPEGQMFEELQRLAFERHPYGRPVIGWEEDLDRMVPADCLHFYRNFYAPNNAVIVVVGDVKPDLVFKTIDKHYGKIASSLLQRPAVAEEPKQVAEKHKTMPLSVQVEKAYMGYKIPTASHADQVPLTVLSAILGQGRSSYLYRAVVESGLGIDVSAGSGAGKDPSLFYITCSAQHEKKAQASIDAIDEVLRKICDGCVGEIDLERAKNKLRTDFYLGLTTNAAKAHFVGQNEVVLGDYQLGLQEMEAIKDVSLSEVAEVTRKYFRQESRTVVIGVPVE